MSEKQQFLFVRHGETVGNLEQIAYGAQVPFPE